MVTRRARSEVLLPQMHRTDRDDIAESLPTSTPPSRCSRVPTARPRAPPRSARRWPTSCYRLQVASSDLVEGVALMGKINGAVGNYNAHLAAYPDVDWARVCPQAFVDRPGARVEPLHHPDRAPRLHRGALPRGGALQQRAASTCDRDVWGYISLGYFKQKTVEPARSVPPPCPTRSTPSTSRTPRATWVSPMPSSSHLARQAARLPLAARPHRLPRCCETWASASPGPASPTSRPLLKASTSSRSTPRVIAEDLDANWEVLAEPIQTVMRRYGIEKPYEKLKELTRGKRVDAAALRAFVEGLDIPEAEKGPPARPYPRHLHRQRSRAGAPDLRRVVSSRRSPVPRAKRCWGASRRGPVPRAKKVGWQCSPTAWVPTVRGRHRP
jgi:adenylosuccinate lyase